MPEGNVSPVNSNGEGKAYDPTRVQIRVEEGVPKAYYGNGEVVDGVLYSEGSKIKLRRAGPEGVATYTLKSVGKGNYRMEEDKGGEPKPLERYSSTPPGREAGYGYGPETSPASVPEESYGSIRVEVTSQDKEGKNITYEIRMPGGSVVNKARVLDGADGNYYVHVEGPQYMRLNKDEDGAYTPERFVQIADKKFFKKSEEEKKKQEQRYTQITSMPAPEAPKPREEEPEQRKKPEKKRELGDVEDVQVYLDKFGPVATFKEKLKKGSRRETRPVYVTGTGEVFIKNTDDFDDPTYTQLRLRRGRAGVMKYIPRDRKVIIEDPLDLFLPPEDANRVLGRKRPSMVDDVFEQYKRRGGRSRVDWF